MPLCLKPPVGREGLRCWYSLKGCGKGSLHHPEIWARTIVSVPGSCPYHVVPCCFLARGTFSPEWSELFGVLSKEAVQPFLSIHADAQKRGSKNSWCIFSRQSRKDFCRAPRPHHHQKCLPWDRGGAKDLSSSLACHRAPSGHPHSMAEAPHLYVLLTVILVWLHRYHLHILCTSDGDVFVYTHACVIYRGTHVCVSIYLRSKRTVRSWGEISAYVISCWQKMFYFWPFLMVVIATTAASGPFCGAVQGGCCTPRAGLPLPVALVAKGTSGSCPWTWRWEPLCTSGQGSRHGPCLSGISLYLHLRNRNFCFGCSSEIHLELVFMDSPSNASSSIWNTALLLHLVTRLLDMELASLRYFLPDSPFLIFSSFIVL